MKMDRLIGILALLLRTDRVTAPMLAERFEVSRRTILRDIDTLCRAGVPVVTAQGAGGGISILEGYRVDRTLLTEEDMRAILAGLRGLDSVSEGRDYARLMEKMAPGAEPDAIWIDLAAWSKPDLAAKFALIRRAIGEARTLRFAYSAPGGDSLREIEPARLIYHWSSWYVWGWCRLREDWRLFKLRRMTELEAGEPFERRGPVPKPDLSTDRVFPERLRLRALFAPRCRWRLLEEYGPDSFREREDGRLEFRFGFTDRDSALGWILSFGTEAELLEPEDLREELRRAGEAIAAKYAGT